MRKSASWPMPWTPSAGDKQAELLLSLLRDGRRLVEQLDGALLTRSDGDLPPSAVEAETFDRAVLGKW